VAAKMEAATKRPIIPAILMDPMPTIDSPNEMITIYRENMREQNNHSPLNLFSNSARYCLFYYYSSFVIVKMALTTKDAAMGKSTNKILRL
jgi:hypothetical protein